MVLERAKSMLEAIRTVPESARTAPETSRTVVAGDATLPLVSSRDALDCSLFGLFENGSVVIRARSSKRGGLEILRVRPARSTDPRFAGICSKICPNTFASIGSLLGMSLIEEPT